MSRTTDARDVDPLVRFMGLQRELQGMSQVTLGKLTGIHPAQISQYENGHTAMPTVKLRKALKALGWDMRAVPLPEDP